MMIWTMKIICSVAMFSGVFVGISPVSDTKTVEPSPGIHFVLDKFDQYPVVAIGELPQCEQVHAFLKSLIQNAGFPGKVNDILVEFGNPLFQEVINRYIVNGEEVPHNELRHVWDDTAQAPALLWESPLYEEFFATVRMVNLVLPKDKKIHIILAGAAIDWKKVHNRKDLAVFSERSRLQAFAEKINAALNGGRRVLIIASAEKHTQISGNSAELISIASVKNIRPGKIYTVVAQGQFGPKDAFREMEAKESSWSVNSVVPVKETWLEDVLADDSSNAPHLHNSVDAVLYLGPSDSLTALRPRLSIFRDDEYFTELNRRWQIVNGKPITATTQLFDVRRVRPQRTSPPPQERPAVAHENPASANGTEQPPASDGVDFIVQTLDRYPMIGIGDMHMNLQFHAFLRRLVRDPKLPGKIDDIVVEFGNPSYQAVIDRYILEGEFVPRDQRRGAWERAPMGCYVSCISIYEQFYDTVREVNLKLPREKRMRITLGDAPRDMLQEIEDNAGDPAALQEMLQKGNALRETAEDPREIALGASINSVLARGHRGIMICGSGHLENPDGIPHGRAGNARSKIEKENPGKFFLVAPAFIPSGSSVPGHLESVIPKIGARAELYLGPAESLTEVGLSPMLYREKDMWEALSLSMKLTSHQQLLERNSSSREFPDVYRGRYFEAPWPNGVEAAPIQ
jgi:hypothetical protein